MGNKLEDDILFFYDYLLFLDTVKTFDKLEDYVGVYIVARKILIKYGMSTSLHPTKFNETNCDYNYLRLSKLFDLSDFRNEIFDIKEIVQFKKQWRLI